MNPQPIDHSQVVEVARAFHDEYEKHAADYGWHTNPSTRVSFDELPESNRLLMVSTVLALLDNGVIALPHASADRGPHA